MLLVEFIIAGVIMAAVFLFLEWKFAKMNEAEKAMTHEIVLKVLNGLGADKIKVTEDGGYHFWIDDEVLWLNVTRAPLVDVILQNTTEGCPDMEVAKQIAAEITSRSAGGRVSLKDEYIYNEGSSILLGEDALEEGLPVILSFLLQLREQFISSYWKAVATKGQDTTPADK